jgi:hypothetical protein
MHGKFSQIVSTGQSPLDQRFKNSSDREENRFVQAGQPRMLSLNDSQSAGFTS